MLLSLQLTILCLSIFKDSLKTKGFEVYKTQRNH